jgi:ABC-2 type transport system ATP-binding protein
LASGRWKLLVGSLASFRIATREEGVAMADMRMLECRGLRRSFGDLVAVGGVGFHIDAGETYGLLGPNGAGKTTTISMIAGLLERDGGEVVVAGEPMTTHAVRAKAAIGYVPQDLAIYPDLSARENLVFFARLYGVPTAEAKRRSRAVLEVTGLADRAGDPTKKYSGGMKRRLNIGIGRLHRPKLPILDEPTVGVDPQSRNAILESVEGLSGEGMAVLYTTHYFNDEDTRRSHRRRTSRHGRTTCRR